MLLALWRNVCIVCMYCAYVSVFISIFCTIINLLVRVRSVRLKQPQIWRDKSQRFQLNELDTS